MAQKYGRMGFHKIKLLFFWREQKYKGISYLHSVCTQKNSRLQSTKKRGEDRKADVNLNVIWIFSKSLSSGKKSLCLQKGLRSLNVFTDLYFMLFHMVAEMLLSHKFLRSLPKVAASLFLPLCWTLIQTHQMLLSGTKPTKYWGCTR